MLGPAESLRRLAAEGLLRETRPLASGAGVQVKRDGKSLWNFGSNDYLGLARHPGIEASFVEGVHRYGAGSAASRLTGGSLPPHVALEEALAEAKQSEAALCFASGFATAVGIIPALVGKGDFIFLDRLSHACLVDGSRLSQATLRVFPHNDANKLRKLLSATRAKSSDARILVVTESVFSMDGDICPLREIVEACEAHDALLLLDEAHAFGVLGENGMGVAEREGLQTRIAFQMGTFSKAAGLSGGYVATSNEWVQWFVNRARSFIYSTAPPPSIAHAALAALTLIRSPEGKVLREKLQRNIATISNGETPIVPVVLGENEATLSASEQLAEAGYLVPAIRFPTVPRGTARLRISISAAHPLPVMNELAAKLSSLRT